MCAGAIFWRNVRRVVYGLSAKSLYSMVGNEAIISLTSREVFERGQWEVTVVGPLLETEAQQVHEGFWH